MSSERRSVRIIRTHIDEIEGIDIMSSRSQQERPQALNEHALRQLILVVIEKGYYTEYLHHPERNISVDDVIHGLERSDWTLVGHPDWDESYRSYKYRICTADIEGEELTIVLAAYPNEKRIAILTAW
jgi:hypothetical protein